LCVLMGTLQAFNFENSANETSICSWWKSQAPTTQCTSSHTIQLQIWTSLQVNKGSDS
jgi:hypothetical protein